MRLKKGFVHIYTGDGKGKTTAALGLGMRAAGSGLNVILFQFLKGEGEPSSELKTVEGLSNFEAIRFDQVHPMFWPAELKVDPVQEKKMSRELRHSIAGALNEVRSAINCGKYDVIILDELINAVSSNLVDVNAVLELIASRPKYVELILTGRGAPFELISRADYVTEMREIRHPYRRGITGRKGIEE